MHSVLMLWQRPKGMLGHALSASAVAATSRGALVLWQRSEGMLVLHYVRVLQQRFNKVLVLQIVASARQRSNGVSLSATPDHACPCGRPGASCYPTSNLGRHCLPVSLTAMGLSVSDVGHSCCLDQVFCPCLFSNACPQR
eukprot:1157224-Pelagomonas_calceolata.AAC.7